MEIGELIEILTELKEQYGADAECVIGCGFDKDGRLETLSLQALPYGGGSEIVFEEYYHGESCLLEGGKNP